MEFLRMRFLLVSISCTLGLLFCTPLVKAQQRRIFSIPLHQRVDIGSVPADFNPRIYNLEAPKPGGPGYASFLMRRKAEAARYFGNESRTVEQKQTSLDPPDTLASFGTYRFLSNGSRSILVGGIPNDNTLAVSNNNLVMIGLNSFIYGYSLNTDTTLYQNGSRSLGSWAGGSGLGDFYFDPKVYYDPVADRFILAFLKNSDPSRNRYFIAFSETNNPAGAWNVYSLPGNPLNNNRWTDYPAIGVTDTHVYLTGNLIVPGEPWQTGFDGTIIWQLNKEAGYAGSANLDAALYSDIRFNGKYIRNLCPVNGSMGTMPEALFLSNRNFDIVNDSIFVVRVFPDATDSLGILDARVIRSSTAYSVPPNGKQFDTPLQDTAGGLQTNDARVLGALMHKDKIHFVGNSRDLLSNRAAVYYGIITDPLNNPSCTAEHISGNSIDYAYPNLAYAGNETCEDQFLIGFNYTSKTDFPGTAAVTTDGQGNFSPVLRLKEGENYVNRLPDAYERWGDYFGIQRKYNDNVVLASGFYGTSTRANTAYTHVLALPDTTRMLARIEQTDNARFCRGTLLAKVQNGVPPFSYSWNGNAGSEALLNACMDSVYNLTITDTRNCKASAVLSLDSIAKLPSGRAYPNPFQDELAMQFTAPLDGMVDVQIHDVAGKLVFAHQRFVSKGLNELVLSLQPLSNGEYVMTLFQGDAILIRDKLIKIANR